MTATAPAPQELSFGHSLLAATPDPAPLPDDLPDGHGLAAAARATPFLTRLKLLLPQLAEPGGLPATIACMRADVYARNQEDDVLGGRAGYAATLLGIAVDAGLVDVQEQARPPRLVAGPLSDLVADQPLAAWGLALEPALFGNPIAEHEANPRWHDEGMVTVPPLLLQCLALACAPMRLDPLADGLLAEIRGLAEGRTPPSRKRLRRQLRLVATLLRELGLICWQTPGRGLGTARVTPLGLFGWAVLAGDADEPPDG